MVKKNRRFFQNYFRDPDRLMKRFFHITVNENESPCSPTGIKWQTTAAIGKTLPSVTASPEDLAP
ncbi:MAG: hypothetical protein DME96_05840 [Verrucomicrobia bacterium]|nr:MAG: hypothetical protein DME93_02715 [Verrucomicrobiota bacterium]PYJ17477.1 MAG: hypothetical protein DME96_05840 [Verrucomicrobiota bacterium]